jgi:hypothetical protein
MRMPRFGVSSEIHRRSGARRKPQRLDLTYEVMCSLIYDILLGLESEASLYSHGRARV